MVMHINKLYTNTAVVTHIYIYAYTAVNRARMCMSPNKKYTGTWYTNQYKQQYCTSTYRGNYYYDLNLRPRKTQRVNSTTPRSRRFLKSFPIFSNRRHVFRRLCPIRGPFIALRQCRRRVNSTTPRSRYRGQDFFSVYPICNSARSLLTRSNDTKEFFWYLRPSA